MKKNELKTGDILTFDNGKKGVIMKDVGGDQTADLILYIDRKYIKDFCKIDKLLDDNLYYVDKELQREKRGVILVERLRDVNSLPMLLNPAYKSVNINSIPTTVVYSRKPMLKKGSKFYTMAIGGILFDHTIEDIYIKDGVAWLVSKEGDYAYHNVYTTKQEALEHLLGRRN